MRLLIAVSSMCTVRTWSFCIDLICRRPAVAPAESQAAIREIWMRGGKCLAPSDEKRARRDAQARGADDRRDAGRYPRLREHPALG
jgi:hypothetical protein